jgi:hypothetical protein
VQAGQIPGYEAQVPLHFSKRQLNVPFKDLGASLLGFIRRLEVCNESIHMVSDDLSQIE